jgi:hypothetical protein
MGITNVNITNGMMEIEIRIHKYRITMIVKSCYVLCSGVLFIISKPDIIP